MTPSTLNAGLGWGLNPTFPRVIVLPGLASRKADGDELRDR